MRSVARFAILVAASALFTSCAQGLQHYRIAGARSEMPKVESVMAAVAAQAGLFKETDDMRDPSAFVAYQKPLKVYMRGDVIDGDILITLHSGDFRVTPAFRQTDQLLRRSLVERFPRRVTARPDADVDSPNITQL
jgi:hypothetical protein